MDKPKYLKQLKVKIKSLAAEAAIIKLEERKAMPRPPGRGDLRGYDQRGRAVWDRPLDKEHADLPTYVSLRDHRVRVVRVESRHALLAYAYLRGKKFCQVERPIRSWAANPDWHKVAKMVVKFGSGGYLPLHNDPSACYEATEPIRDALALWSKGADSPFAPPPQAPPADTPPQIA